MKIFENTMLLSLREQNVDFRVLAYVPHQVQNVVGTQSHYSNHTHRKHNNNPQMSGSLLARLHALLAPFPYHIAQVTAYFSPSRRDKSWAEAEGQYKLFVKV